MDLGTFALTGGFLPRSTILQSDFSKMKPTTTCTSRSVEQVASFCPAFGSISDSAISQCQSLPLSFSACFQSSKFRGWMKKRKRMEKEASKAWTPPALGIRPPLINGLYVISLLTGHRPCGFEKNSQPTQLPARVSTTFPSTTNAGRLDPFWD